MIRLASPLTAAGVGVAHGFAGGADTRTQRWYCAPHEYTSWVAATAVVAGAAATLATDIDRDVTYGLMISGLCLGASRVGSRIARGSGSPGAGCGVAATGGAPMALRAPHAAACNSCNKAMPLAAEIPSPRAPQWSTVDFPAAGTL